MKKITLFVVTVFYLAFNCSSQNASEDSVTEASTEEV